MSQLIDLSDLPEPLAKAIESMVRAYREQSHSGSAPRHTGWAREILPELPQSFFEPLSEEFLGLFEDKQA